MKGPVIALALLILSALIIVKELSLKKPSSQASEGCISCHTLVGDPDPSHPIQAFGCARCHLGNPYAYEKERAHLGVVKNPGDLRTAEHTCGSTGCHSEITSRVKKGLMATNRGILETLQAYWPSRPEMKRGAPPTRVSDLLASNPPGSLAIDQYNKMCGGCHLWKKRKDYPGEAGLRGGGCSDCHIIESDQSFKDGPGKFDHPKITTRIPSENCIKCHNRSARIGLSYFGRYESDGYGTPYHGALLGERKLSGNRFYLDLPSDVHFSKAAMECIDCHTSTGLMGDGNEYNSMEAQVDITCEACHSPSLRHLPEENAQALRLFRLNRMVPDPAGVRVAFTGKGTPLYNLQEREGKIILYRKKDGAPIEIAPNTPVKPHHRMPGHERLSCQACHSLWMPQCYGCHVGYDQSKRQGEWLTGRQTPGRWSEARSFMRFSVPALGLRKGSRVYPVSPCQVFFKSEYFANLVISAFDPHTSSAKSRQCTDCHGNPKTLGFGEGTLRKKEGGWIFRPNFDGLSSSLGIDFSLESFVTPEGRPLHGNSRKGTRSFNGEELVRIMDVNPCLGCHTDYNDPIYRDFRTSKKRFDDGEALPCQR